MARHARSFLLPAILGLWASAGAVASDVAIAPFVGFQYGGELQSATSGRAPIDVGLQYGATLDVPFGDRWGIDVLFARQESELASAPRREIAVERYMAGIREEKGEGRFRFRGSFFLGATRYALDGVGSDARFTLAIGLGSSVALWPRVALRADARAYYAVISSAARTACLDGSCLYLFASSGVWQGDITAGVELRF
jgi:Outer membrane protein beta-barrel domain